VNTDRWYYRVFQSALDLIRSLLPGSAAAENTLGLDPGASGDQLYRLRAARKAARLRPAALLSASSTAAAAPSASPLPSRSRPYQWRSWKPWPTPFSTSRGQPTYPPGWPPIAEAEPLRLFLSART